MINFFLFEVLFLFVVQENFSLRSTFSKFAILSFGIVLVICATFRSPLMDDYANYLLFYNNMGEDRFEKTAYLFRRISPSFYIFLFLYAFIGINVKLLAIREISNFKFYSLITYISTSFVLHDMIQIRVSCAIALFLYALKFLIRKDRIRYILFILIASLFHISALVFSVFVFLNGNRIRKWVWLFFIVLSYCLAFSNLDLLSLLSRYNGNAYYIVTVISHSGSKANYLNINQLLRILVFVILLFYLKKDDYKNILLLKIFAISIIILPLFCTVPVIAYRISEMIGTVIIFLLPELIDSFKKKEIGFELFIVINMMLFYLNNIHNGKLL